MIFNNKNKFKHLDIAVPLLGVLLLVELLLFVLNSIQIVSETNRNNFEYTIKIRSTIEEIDKIVERAEVNLNLMTQIINGNYDTSKINDKETNLEYLRRIDVLVKSVLLNSPGIDGVWYQPNIEYSYATQNYLRYILRNNKIINLKAVIEKENPNIRTLTPNTAPYYFEAVKEKKIIWSDIYTNPDTKIPIITISQPIYKNDILIGVAGIDISLKNLQQALKNMQSVFSGSEIFLLDKNKHIIASQLLNDQSAQKNTKLFKNLFYGIHKSDAMEKFIDNGVAKTAIILELSNKYYIVVTFPEIIVLNGFKRLFNTIYIILAIMGVLAILAIINRGIIIKINKKLEIENSTIKNMINYSPTIMCSKDNNGVYTRCNEHFAELTNFRKEDIIGKTDYEIFEKEIADILASKDEEAKRKRECIIDERWHITQNGEKRLLLKYRLPLFDENNEAVGVFVNAIDITKKHQEQKLLQQAKETAEKATAMKSNFLANMSHEIRTPMNGVLGFIQLLQETNPTDEQSEFIKDARKSSEMLLDIINDILDFSKIEANKLKIDNISFYIRSVVEDVIIMATSAAENKGLEINALICSDIPKRVFGDPGRVKQILTNFISNAVKFTPKGEIVVYVSQVSEDDENTLIKFEVKDTGIGIEEGKLSTIFDAFTQADASTTRKFGGTGLGLAISKKLVELMDGTINVESKINEGSTFSITLPFKKDNSVSKEISGSIKTLDGTKILVVDSNPTDLKIIHYYLSEANCIIFEAHTPKEALGIINRENISAILIDYKAQNINGEELSLKIKQNEKSKDVPLLLYTSLAKRGDSTLAKEKGFAGYLTKPIKKYELIDTLSMMINASNESPKFVTKHIVKEQKFNSKAKILVVEDCEMNCKLILKILNHKGLSCDFAFNGQEAIDAYKSKQYDIIFMDCQMPILDGYEATKEIRKIENGQKHTPIIALTASAMASDKEKCTEAGMDEFITKPIDIDVLTKTLNKYIKPEILENNEITGSEAANEISTIIKIMTSELEFKLHEAVQFFADYMKFMPQLIYELESAVAENNFELLTMLTGNLKCSSSNLKIEKFCQLSIDLEEAACKGDKQSCSDIINKIKIHFKYLDALMDNFL